MSRTERVSHVLQQAPGVRVQVEGWLRSARHSRERSFLDLVDGSGPAGLQIVADQALGNYQGELRSLPTGAALRAQGVLVESPGGGQRVELAADAVTLVAGVAPGYPLQKKRHSFEFLREIAHLRPRTNTFGSVLRVRNHAARAIHHFFQERGFVWLHTPILTAADAEGAGEMFELKDSEAFFGRSARLTVSGQLEAEAFALALSRVYSFGPTFRAENSNTSRHLSEFWMVEPEVAFCDLAGNAELAEQFLKAVLADLLESAADDLEFFEARIAPGILQTLEQVVRTPFARMSYSEAVALLEKSGAKFEFPVRFGVDLQSEHERYLCETHVKGPLVITDYPAEIKAFYMYLNDDGRTVRAMDVLLPRIGEIIGGSQREHRHDMLRERMQAQGLDLETYRWYLDLSRYGGAPHAGFGLGFERLVQFVTGMANIRDVMPFPRTPGRLDF